MGLNQSSIKSPFFFFIILVISITTCKAHNPKFFKYSYPTFNETHDDIFSKTGDGSIVKGALQLTPDSIQEWFSLLHKSGRVMFKKPFKLWEQKNEKIILASFNSTFDINVFPASLNANDSRIPGEGLAFVIARDVNTPLNSYGQWLGLTNETVDRATSNKFVAIELDTVKQDYDPDDNHMGLNINSIRSNKTVSLSRFNITIAQDDSKNWTIWVQYNGSSMGLDVYMARQHDPRPNEPVLSADINLTDYVKRESYIGFSGSTGSTAELNCVLRWDLTVEILPEKKDWTWLKILVGVGVPVLAVLVGCVVWLVCYLCKRRNAYDSRISCVLKELPGAPREFRYKDLKNATKNFDEEMKLAEGGFGVVYKGVLGKDNVEVAVKKFSRESIKGKDDFLSELTIINRLRYKHLVKLIGWCHRGTTLLLVYEYMPNGSLDSHLFSGSTKFLSWAHRYNIVSGIASAVHYLHNEYDQTVVHRDLKSSNILLDADYNARLGDFGLARVIEHDRTSYAELEGVPGTFGYIAPETLHTGKATRESDVYGFGAVVLEIVCGQRPSIKVNDSLVLVDWVWKLYREGQILDAIDKKLGDDYVSEEASRLLLLGLACSHPTASERPTTQTVVQIISGSVPIPVVPHFKPAFVWTGSTDDIMSRDTTYTTLSHHLIIAEIRL